MSETICIFTVSCYMLEIKKKKKKKEIVTDLSNTSTIEGQGILAFGNRPDKVVYISLIWRPCVEYRHTRITLWDWKLEEERKREPRLELAEVVTVRDRRLERYLRGY